MYRYLHNFNCGALSCVASTVQAAPLGQKERQRLQDWRGWLISWSIEFHWLALCHTLNSPRSAQVGSSLTTLLLARRVPCQAVCKEACHPSNKYAFKLLKSLTFRILTKSQIQRKTWKNRFNAVSNPLPLHFIYIIFASFYIHNCAVADMSVAA